MRKRVHDKSGKALRNCAGNKSNGFTLTELIVVVVLIGVIAAFAIPEYGKIIRKSQERNTIMDLLSLHSANEVYKAKKGEFLPGAGLNLAQINAGLSINLKGLDVTYAYTRGSGIYVASAIGISGNNFILRVDERPINLAGNNPCCFAGPCPTLPPC